MDQQPLLIRAIKKEKVERTPVWLMRQAGRYMPEYRAVRANHRMLDLIRTPELAAEVTMQPIRRFAPDAAIIFADILNPLIGMGVELDFVEGEGPRIFNPVSNVSDVERLIVPDMRESVKYTLDAIKICVESLRPFNIPLLGFSGAPFTLSCYLIEGGELGQLKKTKAFMFEQQDAWHKMQEKLSALIVDYLLAQIDCGAAAVQIFDSWVGHLGASEYSRFVEPHLKNIISQLRSRTKAPLMYFSTNTAGIFNQIKEIDVDVFSIDWRMSLSSAREQLGTKGVLQGNLDPLVLAGPREYLNQQLERILNEGKKVGPYIFNLGHGILPHTPPENVERVISYIKKTKC